MFYTAFLGLTKIKYLVPQSHQLPFKRPAVRASRLTVLAGGLQDWHDAGDFFLMDLVIGRNWRFSYFQQIPLQKDSKLCKDL